MDLTDHLRAWSDAHAQARRAEIAARNSGDAPSAGALHQQAQSLRERADRMHREIYRKLDRSGKDTPR